MFCSKISKLGGMVDLCRNMYPKLPPYYKVMIFSNSVVPCEYFVGSNVTLGVLMLEILTKMYKGNSELEAILDTFSLNLTYFLSLFQKFDK